jgi:hypothetical protein
LTFNGLHGIISQIIVLLIHIVFEDRVLRRIFGPKRQEARGGCRKLHGAFHGDTGVPPFLLAWDSPASWILLFSCEWKAAFR